MNSNFKCIWRLAAVCLVAIAAWIGIKDVKTSGRSEVADEHKSRIQNILDRHPKAYGPKENLGVPPVPEKTEVEAQIKNLLEHVGDRPSEPGSDATNETIIRQHKKDMTMPLEQRFPNAKKLVDMGDVSIVPLAVFIANLPDSPSDRFLAANFALRSLLSRDEIQELFLALAKKAPSEEERRRFQRAVRLFK